MGFDLAQELLRNDDPVDPSIFWHLNMREGLTHTLSALGIYSASFSLNPESLYQWRCYADDGRGVAIGFSPSLFEPSFDETGTPIYDDIRGYRVNYDSKELFDQLTRATSYVRDIYSRASARLREPYSDVRDAGDWAAKPDIEKKYAYFVLFSSMLFKHRAYSEEQEYRMVIADDHRKLAQLLTRSQRLLGLKAWRFRTSSEAASPTDRPAARG